MVTNKMLAQALDTKLKGEYQEAFCQYASLLNNNIAKNNIKYAYKLLKKMNECLSMMKTLEQVVATMETASVPQPQEINK